MTLNDMAQSDKATLSCREVCEVLGCAEYSLHTQAMTHPERLGFPVVCIGRRVRIPRLTFLAYIQGA